MTACPACGQKTLYRGFLATSVECLNIECVNSKAVRSDGSSPSTLKEFLCQPASTQSVEKEALTEALSKKGCKVSIYFPDDIVAELKSESKVTLQLDRYTMYIIAQAFKIPFEEGRSAETVAQTILHSESTVQKLLQLGVSYIHDILQQVDPNSPLLSARGEKWLTEVFEHTQTSLTAMNLLKAAHAAGIIEGSKKHAPSQPFVEIIRRERGQFYIRLLGDVSADYRDALYCFVEVGLDENKRLPVSATEEVGMIEGFPTWKLHIKNAIEGRSILSHANNYNEYVDATVNASVAVPTGENISGQPLYTILTAKWDFKFNTEDYRRDGDKWDPA